MGKKRSSKSAESDSEPVAPEGQEASEAPEEPTAEESATPEAEAEAPAEAEAEKAPEPDKRTEAQKKADQRRQDLLDFLGPDVKTPGEIPDGYKPTDVSLHPLFRIELGGFMGPLDLLLYLIRKHELDIFDIPITFITERYLEMLEALKSLEIDLAADFLVMAAELTHIKSKMLLPAKQGVAVEDPPEDDSDPRAELVLRLLEYQKYRDAAGQLSDRDQLGRDVFPRNPPNVEAAPELVDTGLKAVSIFRLVEVMASMMRRTPISHEISYETYSISERIHYITAVGEGQGGRFTLLSLMTTVRSRGELVVTFIAVLEMAKMGLIRIFIEESDLPVGTQLPEEKLSEADAAQSQQRDHEDLEAQKEPELQEGGTLLDQIDEVNQLAEEIEADQSEIAAAQIELDELEQAEKPAEPEDLEELPVIWVTLTKKRFQGELVDDYA